MEGDAGTRQLNPTDADTAPDDAPAKPQESLAVSTDEQAEPTTESTGNPVDTRRASRLGVGWVASICAVLLLLAAAGVVGGYLALRSHADSEAMARAEAAALQAAKDCVAATHAPDSAAMTAAQAKIIECSTGDFGVQAALYSSVLVDAYKAANVTVQVSDMRAAVERHNDDGTIDVLVAARVKVTNSDVADQEQGYRLRVKMASDHGVYKVARLDQVTS
jgi:Mce-associated membrane protein